MCCETFYLYFILVHMCVNVNFHHILIQFDLFLSDCSPAFSSETQFTVTFCFVFIMNDEKNERLLEVRNWHSHRLKTYQKYYAKIWKFFYTIWCVWETEKLLSSSNFTQTTKQEQRNEIESFSHLFLKLNNNKQQLDIYKNEKYRWSGAKEDCNFTTLISNACVN
jgi:hypothetical protein